MKKSHCGNKECPFCNLREGEKCTNVLEYVVGKEVVDEVKEVYSYCEKTLDLTKNLLHKKEMERKAFNPFSMKEKKREIENQDDKSFEERLKKLILNPGNEKTDKTEKKREML